MYRRSLYFVTTACSEHLIRCLRELIFSPRLRLCARRRTSPRLSLGSGPGTLCSSAQARVWPPPGSQAAVPVRVLCVQVACVGILLKHNRTHRRIGRKRHTHTRAHAFTNTHRRTKPTHPHTRTHARTRTHLLLEYCQSSGHHADRREHVPWLCVCVCACVRGANK